jgi:hypothetical protein
VGQLRDVEIVFIDRGTGMLQHKVAVPTSESRNVRVEFGPGDHAIVSAFDESEPMAVSRLGGPARPLPPLGNGDRRFDATGRYLRTATGWIDLGSGVVAELPRAICRAGGAIVPAASCAPSPVR